MNRQNLITAFVLVPAAVKLIQRCVYAPAIALLHLACSTPEPTCASFVETADTFDNALPLEHAMSQLYLVNAGC